MASPPTVSYGLITLSGTVTSYLPLTTAWSAPTECSTLYYENLAGGQLYINAPDYANVVVGASTCIPPAVSTWWYNTASSVAPTVYLLGGYSFLCPLAYTTVVNIPEQSATAIGCCPSDYTWASTLLSQGDPRQCSSILPPGTVTFVQPASATNEIEQAVTTSSVLSTSATVWGVQINGYVFPEPTTVSPTTFSNAAMSSASLSTGAGSPKTSGLSQGAQVGIGVGFALGLVGMGSLIATWLLFRRNHRRKTSSLETSLYPKLEINSENVPMPLHEMHVDMPVSQMKLGVRIAEMATSPNDRPAAFEME